MATWLLKKHGIMGDSLVQLSDRYLDEKGETTHVRMSVKEYDRLQKELSDCKRSLEREQSLHRKDVKDLTEKAARDRQMAEAAEKEARKEADLANARAEAAEARAKMREERDENLHRITRERSNAKRGMQPKKKRNGYRFSGKIRQVRKITDRGGFSGTEYTDFWTATLETPYDGRIPIAQIADWIFKDLTGTEGVLAQLGIKYWLNGDETTIWRGSYKEAAYKNRDKENYLFEYSFMMNPKSALWEIQLMTTEAVLVSSEKMDAREKTKSDNPRTCSVNKNDAVPDIEEMGDDDLLCEDIGNDIPTFELSDEDIFF